MRFQVPQFIDQETKIAGPFTFKQFILLAIGGAFIGFVYLSVAKTNFFLFLLASGVIALVTAALAFLRVEGRSFPVILGNFFGFFVSSRIYLWKKKELPPRIVWKKTEDLSRVVKPKIISPELKVIGRSRLKEMSNRVDTQR
ncbi:MAG: PrgI family protein [bacterium]|nr:PrgI family protein [bacterium]